MIENLVREIAAEMSVPSTVIQVVDGRRLGVRNSFLLKMAVNGKIASTIIHQLNMPDSAEGAIGERTRHEIRNALCRLQILLEE